MKIKQFEIWLADLNPPNGTEPGKTRPVVVVQTDLLNTIHPSVVICPLTTNVISETKILRVHVPKGMTSLEKPSDILVDQLRAIDKKRLLTKLGELPKDLRKLIQQNIKIVLDLG